LRGGWGFGGGQEPGGWGGAGLRPSSLGSSGRVRCACVHAWPLSRRLGRGVAWQAARGADQGGGGAGGGARSQQGGGGTAGGQVRRRAGRGGVGRSSRGAAGPARASIPSTAACARERRSAPPPSSMLVSGWTHVLHPVRQPSCSRRPPTRRVTQMPCLPLSPCAQSRAVQAARAGAAHQHRQDPRRAGGGARARAQLPRHARRATAAAAQG
jgi:hypothetical protein